MKWSILTYLLLSAFQVYSLENSNLNPQNSFKSSEIDYISLVEDPNFINQLLQENSTYQNSNQQKTPNEASKSLRKLTASCTAGAANCVTCASSTLCSQCDPSYIPNVDGGCSQSVLSHCDLLQTTTTCNNCSPSYYWGCGACNSLITNCIECSDISTCTKCIPGYIIDGTSCIKCTAHCLDCTDGDCWECETGYYRLNGECSDSHAAGDPHCVEFYPEVGCGKCDPGYTPTENMVCVPDVSGCKEILDSNHNGCHLCKNGYYLTGTACVDCHSKFPHCTICDSTNCRSCEGGFSLDNNNCFDCTTLSECLECSDASTCTKCGTSFLPSDNGSCKSSSLNNCDLVDSTNGNFCKQCSTGYFWDNSSLKCKACNDAMAGCDSCIDENTCDTCKEGYYKSGANCISCTTIFSGCGKCSGGSTCQGCKAGYIFDASGHCISSYLSNCDIASNANNCKTCAKGYASNCAACGAATLPNCACSTFDGLRCIICQQGFINQAGTCVKDCPSNCVDCNSPTVCKQCNSKYFLYDNAGTTSCVYCDTSCTSCNPGPNCFECANIVVEDGSSCRVDSVGYEISLSDFAHTLTETFKIQHLEAHLENNQPKDATNWAISSSTSKQIQILTDNLQESELPIKLDIKFAY